VIETKAIAKMYAAKFILRNDVLWVAEELFSIMEESIQYDPPESQETTKSFLVDIIEVMQNLDREYTEQITAAYLELALQLTPQEK
jgi:hypothetical protein|tara:strand:- start:472 stop:729 length:258 start_codon:yes stop_codon:yes gene_type:complete